VSNLYNLLSIKINFNYDYSVVDILLFNDSFVSIQINISSIKAYNFYDAVTLISPLNNYFSVIVLHETWHLNYFEFKLSGYQTTNSFGIFNKCKI